MTLTRDHNDIVWQCDSPSCHETIETGTSNFDAAMNALKLAHWKYVNDRGEWKHYCVDCQLGLLAPRRGAG